MKITKKSNNIIIFCIIIIGTSLRFLKLGYHELWYDEIIAVIKSVKLPINILNPPLYYTILHYWIKIFGKSEFVLRIPSAIFGILSIYVIFILGKTLFNKQVGILSALILSLSPFHIWYAQEMRPYTIIIFLSLLSTYFLYLVINYKKTNFWLFFVLISTLSLYSNYLYIILLLVQFIYITFSLKKKRLKLKKYFYSLLMISIFFIPWFKNFIKKLIYVKEGFWIQPPTLKSLIITMENFILGYNGSTFTYILSDIIIATITLLAFTSIIKIKKNWQNSLILCSTLFILPILFVFTFSNFIFSIYLDRGLIIFSPYFYLILGVGIASIKKRKIKIFLVLSLVSLIISSNFAYYNNYMPTSEIHHRGTYTKKPIKPIIKFIESHRKENEIIAFTNTSSFTQYKYYAKNKKYHFLFCKNILNSNNKRPYSENDFCQPVNKINLKINKRIWVIASNWARDGKLHEDQNSLCVKKWMDKNFELKLERKIEGVWVLKYIKIDKR